MSSITHDLVDSTEAEHAQFGLRDFSRLERMLLFAVVTECERCISSEGRDCLDTAKSVSCPFVSIREEYGIHDIPEWKELVG